MTSDGGDALGHLLALARIRGAVAATLDAGEPWALRLDGIPGAAFHAIAAGQAHAVVDGHGEVALRQGDVVLLPRGTAHRIASAAGVPAAPFDHAAAAAALRTGVPLRVGTGPASARVLCASFEQDHDVRTAILGALPEVVHVAADAQPPSLRGAVDLLAAELATPGAGTRAVVDHLVDVVFVLVVRAWLAATAGEAADGRSWLHGLGDPIVAAVVAAVHERPDRDWSVADLARHAGVSRATLARRFAELVGMSPAAYLTAVRLDLAAQLLRDTGEPVGAIGRRVGYRSEPAFNRRFARDRGVPPGRFRTESRQAGPERNGIEREQDPLDDGQRGAGAGRQRRRRAAGAMGVGGATTIRSH